MPEEILPSDTRRKVESRIGNVAEGALTYAFPIVYTLIMLGWTQIGPDAVLPEDQLGTYRVFLWFSLLTIGLYGYGCLIGTQARFSAKPHRIIIGFAAALSPIFVPVLMWARSGPAPDSYHPAGLDVEFGGNVLGVMVILVLIFIKMYTAIRRVEEYTSEQR